VSRFGEPFACDRCQKPVAPLDALVGIHRDGGWEEYRGTFCDAKCCDDAIADGSIVDLPKLPTRFHQL